MIVPQMYRELAWTWWIISPPEDYEREAAQFAAAIQRFASGEVCGASWTLDVVGIITTSTLPML